MLYCVVQISMLYWGVYGSVFVLYCGVQDSVILIIMWYRVVLYCGVQGSVIL